MQDLYGRAAVACTSNSERVSSYHHPTQALMLALLPPRPILNLHPSFQLSYDNPKKTPTAASSNCRAAQTHGVCASVLGMVGTGNWDLGAGGEGCSCELQLADVLVDTQLLGLQCVYAQIQNNSLPIPR